jgi:hypothetical protein
VELDPFNCRALARENKQWSINPLRPKTPGKPTMKEAYQHLITWNNQEARKSGRTEVQMGWLAENVDFSADFTEAVFADDIPSLRKRAVRGPVQTYHLDLLTGQLKLLFLNDAGNPHCIPTNRPRISSDKQWAVAALEWSVTPGGGGSSSPGFGRPQYYENTRIQNLKTGAVQIISKQNAEHRIAFSSNQSTLYALYQESATELSPPSVSLEVFQLGSTGSWELDYVKSNHRVFQKACGFGVSMTTNKVITVNGSDRATCRNPSVADLASPTLAPEIIQNPALNDMAQFNSFKWIPNTSFAGGSVRRFSSFLQFTLYNLDTATWRELSIPSKNGIDITWTGTKDGSSIIFGEMSEFKVYDLKSGTISDLL